MLNDKKFAPKPNKFCKWCWFRAENSRRGPHGRWPVPVLIGAETVITRTAEDGKYVFRMAGPLFSLQTSCRTQSPHLRRPTVNGITVFMEAELDIAEATYKVYKCEVDGTYYNAKFVFGWFVPGAFIEGAPYV